MYKVFLNNKEFVLRTFVFVQSGHTGIYQCAVLLICVCRPAGGEVQTGRQPRCRDSEEQSEEPGQRTASCCYHQQTCRYCLGAGNTRTHNMWCEWSQSVMLVFSASSLSVNFGDQQEKPEEDSRVELQETCRWQLRNASQSVFSQLFKIRLNKTSCINNMFCLCLLNWYKSLLKNETVLWYDNTMIKVWLGLHANMTGKFKGNIGFLRDMITAFSLFLSL